jgi:hypothetical protein
VLPSFIRCCLPLCIVVFVLTWDSYYCLKYECVISLCIMGLYVGWVYMLVFLPYIDVSVVCWPTGIWCIVTYVFSSPWPIIEYNLY